MRNRFQLGGILLILAVAQVPATASAQDDGVDGIPARRATRRANPPVTPEGDDTDALPARARRSAGATPIGTHQIDRYEAIRQLRLSLQAGPNNVGDWIILGELAHEVALDLPGDQDDAYYRLSRSAYERASRLDPDNAGLRAAVQLAREQEANAADFDENRKQGARTYLDARRREMAASGNSPTIRVYKTAAIPPDDPRDDADPASDPRQGVQAARNVSYPTYQPYSPPQGRPVTYQQHSDSFAPPAQDPAAQGQPATLRGLADELPGALLNSLKRGAGGAIKTPPR